MLEQRHRTARGDEQDRTGNGRTSGADHPQHRGDGEAEPDVAGLAEEARSGTTTATATAIALFAAGALVAVAAALLIVQNTESATVEWWAWDPTGPMWIVLLLTFVAGLVSGPVLAGAYALMRTRRRHREERIDELAGSSPGR